MAFPLRDFTSWVSHFALLLLIQVNEIMKPWEVLKEANGLQKLDSQDYSPQLSERQAMLKFLVPMASLRFRGLVDSGSEMSLHHCYRHTLKEANY